MALYILRNDICSMEVDAIVNAANTSLQHGGGVAWSIAQAAGWDAMEEASLKVAPCPTGSAVYTPGFALPARYVIHAVGPVWQGGDREEAQKLASAYHSSLALAVELGCKSLAFPLISAGIYGYPREEAFQIAVDTIDGFLEGQRASGQQELAVYLVLFDRDATDHARDLGFELDEFIDDALVAEKKSREPRDRQSSGRFTSIEEACDACAPELASEVAPEVAPEFPFCAIGATPRMAPQKTTRSKAEAKSARRPAARPAPEPAAKPEPEPEPAPELSTGSVPDLSRWLTHLDASFSDTVLELIDAKGLTDPQVYKRVHMSRQAFAKVRKPGYHPKKSTAIILALALELDLEQTQALLARAGYTLSRSFPQDAVVMFFILNDIYDLARINLALFERDMPLLEM